MSNLQTYYHFKLYFQKVDQHTGGKWSIHGTKCNKLQNPVYSPVDYPSKGCKHDIEKSDGDVFNPIFSWCGGPEHASMKEGMANQLCLQQ